MTDEELRRIFRGLPEGEPQPPTFRLGDMVRIKSGPFASFTGQIDGINQAKLLLKVRVEIFGRGHHLKLKFLDVEKVSFS